MRTWMVTARRSGLSVMPIYQDEAGSDDDLGQGCDEVDDDDYIEAEGSDDDD